ncbi:hypothetical protein, partial [Pseudomonas sp. F1002]|uniref:hypothetical protein n=1 Tax=Pseudomonas sp. F1002 TaxID=2738821 RepID=UPI001C435AC8
MAWERPYLLFFEGWNNKKTKQGLRPFLKNRQKKSGILSNSGFSCRTRISQRSSCGGTSRHHTSAAIAA